MPIDSSQREPVKNCVRVSIFVLGLVALPLHVSAQSGEAEAPTDGGELAVSSIPEDAESSVSSESVGQDPNWAPRDRVRRARAGVIVSCVAIGAGGGLLAGAFLYVGDDSGGFDDWNLGPNIAMASFSMVFTLGGLIGMPISAHRLRTAKRELRLEQASKPVSRRARFDPHTSRFVF